MPSLWFDPTLQGPLIDHGPLRPSPFLIVLFYFLEFDVLKRIRSMANSIGVSVSVAESVSLVAAVSGPSTPESICAAHIITFINNLTDLDGTRPWMFWSHYYQ